MSDAVTSGACVAVLAAGRAGGGGWTVQPDAGWTAFHACPSGVSPAALEDRLAGGGSTTVPRRGSGSTLDRNTYCYQKVS
jgi:hypothetical protein